MHVVTVTGSLSSEFGQAYGSLRTLELQGPVFDGGAFGDVYDLVRVDGAPPPSPQIVKVLRDNGFDSARRGFETIEKLQRKVLADNRARRAAGEPEIQSLPALRALPQFSFRGEMGGKPVFGYSADRLDTAGYVPFSRVLDPDEDPEPRRRYVDELTAEDRMLLAYELAEGVHALQKLSYIHGDINPPNLFVDIGECHVALIDFDSGAVTDNPNEAPTTFGKKTDGEWVAPEIMDQILTHRNGPLVVRVDRFTDDWAVTVGIHYLLFLCGPFFVLQRSSSRNIRDYVTRFRWPAFDPADPLFATGIERNHANYTAMLQELPAAVLRRMSDALNEGALIPGQRALPYQWMMALRGSKDVLEILLFQAQPEATLEGRPIQLTWRVAGARWAHIEPEIGEVGDAGTCEVFPRESGVYTLTAQSRGGDTLSERVYVRVMPFPELGTLLVPAPDLSHTVLLRGIHIDAPTLRLEAPTVRIDAPTLRLEPPSFHAPLAVNLGVRFAEPAPPRLPDPPDAAPAPPIGTGAEGADWVPRIGHVFDRLYDRIRSELNSRFGGKP